MGWIKPQQPQYPQLVRALTTLEHSVEGLALKLTDEPRHHFELKVDRDHFNSSRYAIVKPDHRCIIGSYKTLVELEAATDMLDYFGHRYMIYEIISAD